MMTIYILIGAFLILFLGIALLRVRILIDTIVDHYELRVIPLARVYLLVDDGNIGYRWRALFLGGSGQLIPQKGSAKERKTTNKEEVRERENGSKRVVVKKKSKWKLRDLRRLLGSLWRGLKVHNFHFRLNAQDPVSNAWLFPAFYFWRSKGYDVAIQWSGDSQLILDMEHSVHRVAGALIYTYISKTKGQ